MYIPPIIDTFIRIINTFFTTVTSSTQPCDVKLCKKRHGNSDECAGPARDAVTTIRSIDDWLRLSLPRREKPKVSPEGGGAEATNKDWSNETVMEDNFRLDRVTSRLLLSPVHDLFIYLKTSKESIPSHRLHTTSTHTRTQYFFIAPPSFIS